MMIQLNDVVVTTPSYLGDFSELGKNSWTVGELELMKDYFTSKYIDGDLSNPSMIYYAFWGMVKYPPIDKDEITNAFKLHFKK